MPPGPLRAEIKELIGSCINSVEQLEILILLRQKSHLDVATINRELRTSEASVQKRIDDLTRKHLITSRESEGHVTYAYDPPERLVSLIEELIALYATHRVSIINEIFNKPTDKLKDFTNAFRLRDKDK